MDNSFLLVVLGMCVVIVALIVLGYYQKRKRMEEMRALAARQGYHYTERDDALAGALAEFALLSRGHSRRATNVLSTEADGIAATVADYRYVTGYGKHQQTHRRSVLLLESGQLDLPAFVLRPEGLGQKLAGLLGQQDIDFEGQPDFSEVYLLQGPDEARIRALFGHETLAYFARRPGLCVESQGRRMLYYRANRRLAPEEIPSSVEDGLAVLHLLAGERAPALIGEPDSLAGLDAVLADLGVDEVGV
jgi:hypothetical protein